MTTTDPAGGKIVEFVCDESRSTYLDRLGQYAVTAEVLVGPDGQEVLIVGNYGPNLVDQTFRSDTPAHERTGKLPDVWLTRIWGDGVPVTFSHRCGRLNSRGKPCGAYATGPGQGCRWHLDADLVTPRATDRQEAHP